MKQNKSPEKSIINSMKLKANNDPKDQIKGKDILKTKMDANKILSPPATNKSI